MVRIRFQIDGYLEGGFPIEEDDIETITELDCYEELIGFIEEGNAKEALNLVNKNLDAEFIIENISPFEDEGFEFIEVKNVSVLNPNIEEIDGIKIPIFKYFQASLQRPIFSFTCPSALCSEGKQCGAKDRGTLLDQHGARWLYGD